MKLLCLALLLAMPLRVFASDSAKTPHVQVQLLADTAAIAPGADFRLGLRFVLAKGWHVYWQNPGDSGEPPKVNWETLPKLEIENLRFPTPKKIPFGPLANYGYENEVVFLAKGRAPSSAAGSPAASLKARLRWLVCKEDCIPETADLNIDLPFAETAMPVSPEREAWFRAAESRIPQTLPGPAPTWGRRGEWVWLEFAPPGSKNLSNLSAEFFPNQAGLIEPIAPQKVTAKHGTLRLEAKAGAGSQAQDGTVEGLLVFSDLASEERHGFEFRALPAQAAASIDFSVFFLAFLGGMLLNLMPCVFPVLFLKIYGLFQAGSQRREHWRRQGWAYTAGVVASFWALAGLLAALRLGGASLGWGFQLQSPIFLFLMAALFFTMGLSLIGAFEIGGAWMGAGQKLAGREGLSGAFFTGVLATLVATPCIGPFLGAAIGLALGLNPWLSLGIFTCIALGLAFPYLVLTYFPALHRRLPKPGRWMEILKQATGFLMLATVIWLLWVLQRRVAPEVLPGVLSSLLLLAVGLWLVTHVLRASTRRGMTGLRIVLFLLFAAAGGVLGVRALQPAATQPSGMPWTDFSPERLGELRRMGQPVFVNFTAAWCITCQANDLLVFRNAGVIAKLKEKGVVPMKADWTRQDEAISKTLAQFQRQGVPFYLLYGKSETAAPKILPEILTPQIMLQSLEGI